MTTGTRQGYVGKRTLAMFLSNLSDEQEEEDEEFPGLRLFATRGVQKDWRAEEWPPEHVTMTIGVETSDEDHTDEDAAEEKQRQKNRLEPVWSAVDRYGSSR